MHYECMSSELKGYQAEREEVNMFFEDSWTGFLMEDGEVIDLDVDFQESSQRFGSTLEGLFVKEENEG